MHTGRPIRVFDKFRAMQVITKNITRHSPVDQNNFWFKCVKHSFKTMLKVIFFDTAIDTAVSTDTCNTMLWQPQERNTLRKIIRGVGVFIAPASHRIDIASISLIIACNRSTAIKIDNLNRQGGIRVQ